MARIDLVKAFAEVLRGRRQKAGLTQEQLAFEAECHPTYISLLERGQRNPSLVVLGLLADALGTTITSLVRQVETISRKG